MKYDRHDAAPLEFRTLVPARERHQDPCAAVIYLDARLHFVTHASPAERHLIERGGLQVAMLRFDAAPRPAEPSGRGLRLTALRPAPAWGSATS